MKLKRHTHNHFKTLSRSLKTRQSGFSLAELMVTVGIIGLLAAIGIPSVLNYLPNIRLRTAARELYADMQMAKLAAVKTNKVVSMAFVDSAGVPCVGGSYLFNYTDGSGALVTVANVTMQNNVCLASTFAADSGFAADGTPSGALVSVTLTGLPDAIATYVITQSVAGAIRIDN